MEENSAAGPARRAGDDGDDGPGDAVGSHRGPGDPHGDAGQYDEATAESYLGSEEMAVRRHAELPSLLAAVGPVAGVRVLDLACGTGVITRLLLGLGAREVVGVDLSPDMIALARRDTPGTAARFVVADAAGLPHQGAFDTVTAVFLLNYAADRAALGRMARTIAVHLVPGGRFAGTLPNPDHRPAPPTDPRYGVVFGPPAASPSPPPDGYPFPTTLRTPSGTVTITQRRWSAAAVREELEAAGLTDVRLTPWEPDEEGVRTHGSGFWENWRSNPMAVVVSARKPADRAER
jgi:toxoflavin synthase